MTSRPAISAAIVGSGPNGLAAAALLADHGLKVHVFERHSVPGGGSRSQELTLPGFVHDTCSSVHPLGAVSPVFRSLELESRGLHWVDPPVELAHPFDDGTAAVLLRSLKETALRLGPDASSYLRLFSGLADIEFLNDVLSFAPLPPKSIPSKPGTLVNFGLNALHSCSSLARKRFRTDHARALFAGICAHSCLPLDYPGSAAMGLLLGAAGHVNGWPFPRGGSGSITTALSTALEQLGGEIVTGSDVRSLADLPPSDLILFDTSARALEPILGDLLPLRYRRSLSRFRFGPGVFKMDWALSEPIPWRARECRRAGTVHVGGALEELEASERAAVSGKAPERPFVLLSQPSRFDATRAPRGYHTAWAYCHVPHGSGVDMSARIEAQIERFATGFRKTVLARHTRNAIQTEADNPNYVGGDITGGAPTPFQLLFRPVPRWNPYKLPSIDAYLCSASTPPGPGVHGMCGYHAARSAISDLRLGTQKRNLAGPSEPLLNA